MRGLLALGLLLAMCGCGNDDASGGAPSGGADSGTGGGVDAIGGSGGDGVTEPTPILERPPAISHDCTEERPMLPPSSPTESGFGGLVRASGDFFVTYAAPVTVAKIQLDGVVLNPSFALDAHTARVTMTTSDGQDVILVWTEYGSPERLSLARISSALELVGEPVTMPETTSETTQGAAIIPIATGFALLFSTRIDEQLELRFMLLDPQGNATSDWVEVAELGNEDFSARASMIATTDGGYAVTYSVKGVVYFVLLEAEGAQRFSPQPISSGASGAESSVNPNRNVLMQVADRFIVTFTESQLDYMTREGYIRVRIAVIDEQANTALFALQAPAEDIAADSPTLVAIDNRIGLAWTEGSVVWDCSGCISNDDMHFVLIDPNGMVPASEIVTHEHMQNGIQRPMLAADGPDILSAANLDFHAFTEPTTGAIRCVPAE